MSRSKLHYGFIAKYRRPLSFYMGNKNTSSPSLSRQINDTKKSIIEAARNECGFSHRTQNIQIWAQIVKLYLKFNLNH